MNKQQVMLTDGAIEAGKRAITEVVDWTSGGMISAQDVITVFNAIVAELPGPAQFESGIAAALERATANAIEAEKETAALRLYKHNMEARYGMLTNMVSAQYGAAQDEPVGWMTDDGRISTAETKLSMANSSKASFNIPVYTRPSPPSPPAPARQLAEPVSLQSRIAELVSHHGSLRAAARVLEVDPGYLSRLASGEKSDPGEILLRRMGLRSVTTFEKAKS